MVVIMITGNQARMPADIMKRIRRMPRLLIH